MSDAESASTGSAPHEAESLNQSELPLGNTPTGCSEEMDAKRKVIVPKDSQVLPTGHATMSPAMAGMERYKRYLFEVAEPFTGQRVWEIGIGHGANVAWLRQADKTVLATDIDEDCLQSVRERLTDTSRVTVRRIDLHDESSVLACADFAADSVVSFNVLEHIRDDVAALRWIGQACATQARIVLIVPAHPSLHGRMDDEAGHFRRYTRATLTNTLISAGWQVEVARYLNFTGAVGWWYHNRLRRSAGLADASANRQMRSADRWLPRFARLTDPLFGRLAGLSVLAVARRRDN